MISKELQRARSREQSWIPRIGEEERPAFHVTGSVGWINDPNGFSWYQGAYHLFFQSNPYSNLWAPMHWGHVRSRDLIRWERLPCALAPDQEYDNGCGCFSGSALEMPDGKHLILYTGVYHVQEETGRPGVRQVQCVAVGDGVDYEKLPQNPVLSGADLPEGYSRSDFRDPKLWFDPEENRYYAVAVCRGPDGSGAVLLFDSDDALRWRYVCVLDQCRNEYGGMWECPDFFGLDGTHVLMVSPQGMRAQGLEFHPGGGTMVLLGDYDRASHTFTRKRVHAIDYGLDFYAPQTMQTPDGRRIMVAWMQNWATCQAQPENFRWFGQMTLPRELTVEQGRLYQRPVRELEGYRTAPVVHQNVRVSGAQTLEGVSGRTLDLTVAVRPGEGGYREFTLYFAQGGGCSSFVSFRPDSGKVCMDRSGSGFCHDIVHQRTFLVDAKQELKLRVILDRFSAELFFNDGAQAATMTLYTPQTCDGIRFEADGEAVLDVQAYRLEL